MKANSDKFQSLAVGEYSQDEKPTFKIGDANIDCEKTVKLLGVEIDYLSKFDDQMSNICRKVSQQINVLTSIGKILNFDAKKSIYHVFIMSNFDCCLLIWHFCSKGNTEKLQNIHFRAFKFMIQVFNSSYDILLEQAGKTTLHLCCFRCLAQLKLLKIVPSYLRDFICLKKSSDNFWYINLLERPRPKSTGIGNNSFRFQAAKLWNSLPEHAKKITYFDSFRTFINGWDGTQCRRALCR